MPRPTKGPRLYLKRLKNRNPMWVIRDGSNEASTGCAREDVDGAREALKEYLAAHFRPDTSQKQLNKISCAEVLMLYLNDLPADSPSRETFRYHAKALSAYWGDKTLADVKGSTCREYVSQRTTKSKQQLKDARILRGCVKLSTARHELKTLQAAINHWHKESPLEAVPKVTLPKPGERRERVLERHEVAKLLWACRKLSRTPVIMHGGAKMRRDYSYVARFILIGVYTGTRHDAIVRLRWSRNPRNGYVDTERSIIYRRGDAERETSKRRPSVGCNPLLGSMLRRWKAVDEAKEVDHVIHVNGQPILKMKRAWATIVKAAGLGPDVTPHVLRHTCASWLLWEGKTIWDVAGVIGADASTVERVYGHHRKQE